MSAAAPVIFQELRDQTQVGEARRAASEFCRRLGVDETTAGKIAIIVMELATNVVRHGGGGHLLLSVSDDATGKCVEVMALDKGPGITDVTRSMQDGFTTGSTLGTGLGSVRRLSTSFEIFSQAKKGTAVVSRTVIGTSSLDAPVKLGAVAIPLHGESVSGDNWSMRLADGRTVLMVVDGLGHGPAAAEASRAAVDSFQKSTSLNVLEIIEKTHLALRSTRGAAVAVCTLDPAKNRAVFSGIGNVVGVIQSAKGRQSMVSVNGTAGHQVRRFQEFSYEYPKGSTLIMHSDGLSASWSLDAYVGLEHRHPSLVAAVLYRDFNRGRDDATIVCLQSGHD